MKRDLDGLGDLEHSNAESPNDAGSRYPFVIPGMDQNVENIDLSGSLVNPFAVPPYPIAIALVRTHFTTVHPGFPIIDEGHFMERCERYLQYPTLDEFKDRTFVTLLQIVLAIGAFQAHMTKAAWVGDAGDHLLYFSRASMMGLNSNFLGEVGSLDRAQILGLGALYLVILGQTDRAWNLVSISIREAQCLGMHLQDPSPPLADKERSFRSLVWHAILLLERTVAVITGRPSMVDSHSCSVLLPARGIPSASSMILAIEIHYQQGLEVRDERLSPHRDSPSNGAKHQQPRPERPEDRERSEFFAQCVEISALEQKVVFDLYSPGARQEKWSTIQGTMLRLDSQLVHWRTSLPANPRNKRTRHRGTRIYQAALDVLFHSTRIIIYRPCLCRLDGRLPAQSQSTRRFNQTSAQHCVESARAVLKIICKEPDPAIIHQGPKWWMILHHLKRAVMVLFLGIVCRNADAPLDVEGILNDANVAIKWLQTMAVYHQAAEYLWITLHDHLQVVTTKSRTGSPPDIHSPWSHGGVDTRNLAVQETEQPQFPSMATNNHIQLPSLYGNFQTREADPLNFASGDWRRMVNNSMAMDITADGTKLEDSPMNMADGLGLQNWGWQYQH